MSMLHCDLSENEHMNEFILKWIKWDFRPNKLGIYFIDFVISDWKFCFRNATLQLSTASCDQNEHSWVNTPETPSTSGPNWCFGGISSCWLDIWRSSFIPLTKCLDQRCKQTHFRPSVNRPPRLLPIMREEGNVRLKNRAACDDERNRS